MSILRSYRSLFIIICFVSLFTPAYAQLTVNPSQTALTLATKLVGTGVSISAPSLTCPAVANGTFVSVSTPLAIDSGIILCTGRSVGASGAEPTLASTNNSGAGDAQLTTLVGTTTRDACILEFDLVPFGDSVRFNYQFGSEEYNHSTCGQYNDPFAFFISGPGIVGSQNMALIPGTNTPVTVNSVNSGIPGPTSLCASCNIANCTSVGPGSPFTIYYVDNTGGTDLTYVGFTKKFTAAHDVVPCGTYHLKMAIADAGNSLYDSGVFIEAGSLSAPIFGFVHTDSIGSTVNSVPHTIVKGCTAATVRVNVAHVKPVPQAVNILFGGTAVMGVDVATIASPVIIPADSASAPITIQGLPTAAGGTKTFTIYLQTNCGISDSITVNILDTPSAIITSRDTTICSGQSFQVLVNSTTGLTYSWSPVGSLSSSTLAQPVAFPVSNTVYTMTASLVNSGCAAIVGHIAVTVTTITINVLTPDTSICNGQTVHIRVDGSDTLSYLWSPATGVDNINIKQPGLTPHVNTTYTVVGTSPHGCAATDAITVSIVTIPGGILTPDTMICLGKSVPVAATGDPAIHYQWLPTAGIAASDVLSPLITPDTSATYYLTAAMDGCSSVLDSIKIDVQPNPTVYLGGNRAVCEFDSLRLIPSVTPAWYTHYIYTWTPDSVLDDTTAPYTVFHSNDTAKIVLTVSTPAGCVAADSMVVVVYPNNFAMLAFTDTSICPGDSVQLLPIGGISYHWSPPLYLSDPIAPAPWVHPVTSQVYDAVVTSQYGCKDTLSMKVRVLPAAVIYLQDSTTIYPGETYHISLETNCTSFRWTPPGGLSDTRISNPVAAPENNTKYVVYATTEDGCYTKDSINIYVSPESLLALPNAFAPGSGPNGVFRIIKRGEAVLNHFRIYNRWGVVVYDGNNIDAGWDGTFNGAPQPLGVYVYDVEAVSSIGTAFHRTGNVTLLR